jgi:hypothetical protein
MRFGMFDEKALNTEIKPVVEIIIIAVVLLKQGYKISRYFSVVFSKVAPNVRMNRRVSILSDALPSK